jgi:enhancer of yellow 2 transcription factor
MQLEESGKKIQFEAELTRKLSECGWRDDMKAKCVQIIQGKGKDNVTVDELARMIAPAGKAAVPDSLKAEMLASMKDFLHGLEL